ncbi:MAG: hypothetical protein AABY53_02350 [Bdellovibrionota bacterium]
MLFKSLLAIATTLTLSSTFAANETVSYQDAPKYYNQTKTVEGTIATAFCDDKRCFLNFDKDYRKYLSAVIDPADLAKFTKATGAAAQAEMEKLYAGKKVQITGAITEYKSKDATKPGRPQILLTDAEKIKIVVK